MPKAKRGEERKPVRQRKVYAHTRDPRSGKRVLAHRWIAEQSLGRPLLPREVVHHKDGNSLNNDPSNLIVLPSQRVHAHAEFHLRRVRSGMPSLFPEFFQVIPSDTWGTLFAHVLVWQGQEPPLPQKVEAKPQQSSSTQPTLFPPPQERSLTPLLPEIEPGVCLVGELLARFQVQVGYEGGEMHVPIHHAGLANLARDRQLLETAACRQEIAD
ncbi:HNH endonuclease signature motif containing protein [Deinococcus wulumuqiensis]|uniref:HNH endonuclease signature motif containing protein n=1 Tax=Deinococcus wulumuqiensis TaxID=980427 RepID=UPI0009D966A7|nr:HNH endonuclease signature motif containing protein [Deinococcus wulumuqiensis]QII22285.1 HNH endonuclease [Deinococcus wulumuqiensis R12]